MKNSFICMQGVIKDRPEEYKEDGKEGISIDRRLISSHS